MASDAQHDPDDTATADYWPARALQLVGDGAYSRAVELCKERLADSEVPVSGRFAYAQALYLAGQVERAREELALVIAVDPDNLAALRLLGDLASAAGDEWTAISYYERILSIDPYCAGLRTPVNPASRKSPSLTLTRGAEDINASRSAKPVRQASVDIPFFTETMADLYFAQGHARHAAEVYRRLNHGTPNPRISEKLLAAEARLKEKGN